MSKKILIVEDEQYLMDMYKLKFKQVGYEIIAAMDGEIALEILKTVRPDLILLDIVMPGIDGFEVLDKLKKNKKTRDIKVLILSNLGQDEEIKSGMEKGADGYLVKANLTPAQIVEKVNELLAVDVAMPQKTAMEKAGRAAGTINNKISNGINILLVEDEKAIIEMYKLRLEKEGYNVEIARNGAWGAKQARENNYDAIVMDMVMPALGGYELLQQLKASAKNKKAPIIVLSNSAQDEDIAKAKKIGASGFLLKAKITPAKLVKEIKKYVK